MSDEKAKSGTLHTHVFIVCSSPVRLNTIINRFNGAHIEIAKGSCQQCRDYVFKEGKWTYDEKSETNLHDSHEEFGQMPNERLGERNDLTIIYDLVKQRLSVSEIIDLYPKYIFQIEKIERAIQMVRQEQNKNTFRNLDVTYVFGATDLGKTRWIMEYYGYENVFKVTDYTHPFDGYKSQDVIMFDEFRSSLKIRDMLNYLDGYPLELPCRYANKTALFTKVYIVSNIKLEAQYENVQEGEPPTWQAFLRRIHKVKEYTDVNTFIECTTGEYFAKPKIFGNLRLLRKVNSI